MQPLIHFEDGSKRPEVFRITPARVAAARKRSGAGPLVGISCGIDFEGIGRWIGKANGLVTSSAVLLDKRFPLRTLAKDAPQLAWIHVIGAGVEGLMPLQEGIKLILQLQLAA